MIIGVFEQYYDHEVDIYFLDADKLDPNKRIDKAILDAVYENSVAYVIVDANYFDDEDENFHPSESAKVINSTADRLMHLVISFE